MAFITQLLTTADDRALLAEIREELRLQRVALETLTRLIANATNQSADEVLPPLPGTPEEQAMRRDDEARGLALLLQTDEDYRLLELEDDFERRYRRGMTEEERTATLDALREAASRDASRGRG